MQELKLAIYRLRSESSSTELALLPPVMHVHNVQNEEHEDVAAHTSGHPGIL